MKAEMIIRFVNECSCLCMIYKNWEILSMKIKKDIEKWYEADQEYNDSSYSNTNIPWPVKDLIKLNIKRYLKDIKDVDKILDYVEIAYNRSNNQGY